MSIILIFGIILAISTFNKKALTYKGITIMMLINNGLLLAYCSYN